MRLITFIALVMMSSALADTPPPGIYTLNGYEYYRFGETADGSFPVELLWPDDPDGDLEDKRPDRYVVGANPHRIRGEVISDNRFALIWEFAYEREYNPLGAETSLKPGDTGYRAALFVNDDDQSFDALVPYDFFFRGITDIELEETLEDWKGGTTLDQRYGSLDSLYHVEVTELLDVLPFVEAGKFEEARALLDTIRSTHSNDPLALAFQLDLLLLREQLEDFHSLFTQESSILKESTNACFRSYGDRYQFISDIWQKDRRNIVVDIEKIMTRTPEHSMYSTRSIDEVLDWMASIDESDYYLEINLQVLNAYPRVPNFLGFQVTTKLNNVYSVLLLMNQEKQEAIDRLIGNAWLGRHMIAPHSLLISKLIGVAIINITCQGLDTFYFNALWTAREIEEYWPRLDRFFREITPLTTTYLKDGIPYESRQINPFQSLLETETRTQVMAAQVSLIHSGVAAKHQFFKEGKFPNSETFSALLMNPDSDPFADYQKPLKWIAESPDLFTIYSIGPDQKDNKARITYDPTNGTISPGDIILRIPAANEFPFPRWGKLPADRDRFLQTFRNGFPDDPFADMRGASLGITDEKPPRIFSFGPNVNQADALGPTYIPPKHSTPPASGSTAYYKHDGKWMEYEYELEAQYDPTNGVISEGDIWFEVR